MGGRERGWTLDSIAWERFDASKVDADVLAIIKAAALVEFNGTDYAAYLIAVFSDDPAFQAAARQWGGEEVQHGRALARWAELADPGFDFAVASRRFSERIRMPLDADESVRGTRCAELVARCIVEVGTSSFYTALTDAVEEPVLRQICRHIAADEVRHYKLFYTHMKRYQAQEDTSAVARLRIVVQRIWETKDDELAYAYHTANFTGRYERRRCANAYARRAFGCYGPEHAEQAVAMILKAVGLPARGRLNRWLGRIAYRVVSFRVRRLAAAGA